MEGGRCIQLRAYFLIPDIAHITPSGLVLGRQVTLLATVFNFFEYSQFPRHSGQGRDMAAYHPYPRRQFRMHGIFGRRFYYQEKGSEQ